MPLTSRRELHLERCRSTYHLIFIRIEIDCDPLVLLVNRMLNLKRPKNLCYLAPLGALSDLDACADGAAGAVIVVTAVFEVLGFCVNPGWLRVTEIPIRSKSPAFPYSKWFKAQWGTIMVAPFGWFCGSMIAETGYVRNVMSDYDEHANVLLYCVQR